MTKEQAVSLWQTLAGKKNLSIHTGIKVLQAWKRLPMLEERQRDLSERGIPDVSSSLSSRTARINELKDEFDMVIDFLESWKSALIAQRDEVAQKAEEARLLRDSYSEEY